MPNSIHSSQQKEAMLHAWALFGIFSMAKDKAVGSIIFGLHEEPNLLPDPMLHTLPTLTTTLGNNWKYYCE